MLNPKDIRIILHLIGKERDCINWERECYAHDPLLDSAEKDLDELKAKLKEIDDEV